MNARRDPAFLVALLLPVWLMLSLGSTNSLVQAQESVRWQVPPAVIPIDFTKQNPAPRKALAKKGLAWEIPVAVAMLRESLTLAAKLPEAGEASFLLNTPDALVDIKTNRVDAGTVNISIRSQLGRLSVDELQKTVQDKTNKVLAEPRKQAGEEAKKKKPAELRKYLGNRARGREDDALAKLYVQRRGIELGKDLLRTALEQLATQRPRWATQTQQTSWLKADADTLHKDFELFSKLLLADEHLRQCGIELAPNTRNLEALIMSKFQSLHTLVTGGTASPDSNAVQTLTHDELARSRKALVVEGVCQFVPATDDSDANSQWFNAQRIGVSVSGVPEIRVVGSLDPKQGDRSDWWALVGYREDQVQLRFPDNTDFRYELYQDAGQRTCLRIIAANQKSVAYTFALRKRSSPTSGEAVVVHESPGESNAKFPF